MWLAAGGDEDGLGGQGYRDGSARGERGRFGARAVDPDGDVAGQLDADRVTEPRKVLVVTIPLPFSATSMVRASGRTSMVRASGRTSTSTAVSSGT